MDTIIYLSVSRKQNIEYGSCAPAMFHVRELRGEPHLLYVELFEAIYDCPKEEGSLCQEGSFPQLAVWLIPFLNHSSSVDTVLDPTMQKWLTQQGLSKRWQTLWPYPEFTDYRRAEYAELLFGKAIQYVSASQTSMGKELINVYVLGYDTYVPKLFLSCFRRIKSLTFIQSRGDSPKGLTGVRYAQEAMQRAHLEAYLEYLYEEEGIAANCKILEEGQKYRNLRLQCEVPAIVLDMTDEVRVAPMGKGSGISWIDMSSSDEKRRRLEARNAGVCYYSMKEEWRKQKNSVNTPEENLNSLDTTVKNGYNT